MVVEESISTSEDKSEEDLGMRLEVRLLVICSSSTSSNTGWNVVVEGAQVAGLVC